MTYINGQLTQALTRGDGIHGRDILDKMRLIVPEYIQVKGIVQVTGEVVAPERIENARNYAAGALNLKYLGEFMDRQILFYAYVWKMMVITWATQSTEIHGKFVWSF